MVATRLLQERFRTIDGSTVLFKTRVVGNVSSVPGSGWEEEEARRAKSTSPLKILKARKRLARRRLRSGEKRLRWQNLPCCNPFTLSGWSISTLNVERRLPLQTSGVAAAWQGTVG